MKILKTTQVRENYGAHDWDGNGECPQYWKNKGGSDYVFTGIPAEEINDVLQAELDEKLRHSNDYWEEFVVFTKILEDEADLGLEDWEMEYVEYQDWKEALS